MNLPDDPPCWYTRKEIQTLALGAGAWGAFLGLCSGALAVYIALGSQCPL